MSNKLSETQLESIINLLTNQRDITMTLNQRKEISIWSATVVYMAIFWSSIVLISDKSIVFSLWITLPIIILSGVICIIFFVFIFSQYGSWIHSTAATRALNCGIFKLITESEKLSSSDLKFDGESSLPKFIQEDLKDNHSKKLDQFRNQKRPWQVLKYLWTFRWKNRLNTRERQEAAIYTILILVPIIFVTILFFKSGLI